MKQKEKIAKIIFLLAASFSILAVLLICFFLFVNGIPAINKIGLLDFLSGTKWKPGNDLYGIFPMILGSLYVTAGALLIGGPIGLMTAIFLSKFCPDHLRKILKPAVDLLAGIPSVVYGFFGLMILVPAIRSLFGGTGSSMLCAMILLGIMILPTIISVSESALNAVPQSYYEGARALGATHERAVFLISLPAAKSGISAAFILGIGRAIGETMAVVMVAGNQARMPKGLTKGIRTLTSNIVIEMGYAADLHRDALIATGVALFVFILLINISFNAIKNRGKAC
ncbi:MAG: phosphate ABC transporter permease subunit PstC [Treponema sp.]|nr:phosphate ABC transporter permease subunit PstC [Treponema sp.]